MQFSTINTISLPWKYRIGMEDRLKMHVTHFFCKICRKKIQCVNNEKLPVLNRGYVVAQLVEVLRYKSESCCLDSRWVQWYFLLT